MHLRLMLTAFLFLRSLSASAEYCESAFLTPESVSSWATQIRTAQQNIVDPELQQQIQDVLREIENYERLFSQLIEADARFEREWQAWIKNQEHAVEASLDLESVDQALTSAINTREKTRLIKWWYYLTVSTHAADESQYQYENLTRQIEAYRKRKERAVNQQSIVVHSVDVSYRKLREINGEKLRLEDLLLNLLHNKIRPKMTAIKSKIHDERLSERLHSAQRGTLITVRRRTDSNLIIDTLANRAPSFQILKLKLRPAFLTRSPKSYISITPSSETSPDYMNVTGTIDVIWQLREEFSLHQYPDVFIEVVNSDHIKIHDPKRNSQWWHLLKQLTPNVAELTIQF